MGGGEGGKSKRSASPGKSPKYFFLYMGGLFATSYPYGDLFVLRDLFGLAPYDNFCGRLLGYEPLDLTVHPPPRTAEGGFIFFRISV